jgi:hypothetical protein
MKGREGLKKTNGFFPSSFFCCSSNKWFFHLQMANRKFSFEVSHQLDVLYFTKKHFSKSSFDKNMSWTIEKRQVKCWMQMCHP